jgi:hypothetical protein
MLSRPMATLNMFSTKTLMWSAPTKLTRPTAVRSSAQPYRGSHAHQRAEEAGARLKCKARMAVQGGAGRQARSWSRRTQPGTHSWAEQQHSCLDVDVDERADVKHAALRQRVGVQWCEHCPLRELCAVFR